jgi:hypothetical protein
VSSVFLISRFFAAGRRIVAGQDQVRQADGLHHRDLRGQVWDPRIDLSAEKKHKKNKFQVLELWQKIIPKTFLLGLFLRNEFANSI